MRWTLCPLLILFALLPSTTAEPLPTTQRTTVIETDSGISVVDFLTWDAATSEGYEGVARFYVPDGATAPRFTLWPQTGIRQELAGDAAAEEAGAPEGFKKWRANFTDLQPAPPADGKYSVSVSYAITGTTINLQTHYAVENLVLVAGPQPDREPSSPFFTGFAPTGDGTVHAVKSDVPGDTSYTVAFQASLAASSAKDLSLWVWAAGGLAAGLLLFYVLVRGGIVRPAAKARRFVKGGAMESRAMLEARRRTLMAALKELEGAHEIKDVPDDAYFPLKEEYKQQAVRVMRNLDEKRE